MLGSSMRRLLIGVFSIIVLTLVHESNSAAVMSIDLGNEWMKVISVE